MRIICCPKCLGDILLIGNLIKCKNCNQEFKVEEGVFNFLPLNLEKSMLKEINWTDKTEKTIGKAMKKKEPIPLPYKHLFAHKYVREMMKNTIEILKQHINSDPFFSISGMAV